MAIGQILSIPTTSGLAPADTLVAWTPGLYLEASASLLKDIDVIGFDWCITTPLGVNTTTEFMFEIATGAIGLEVVKVQIPYSLRGNTAAGYYHLPYMTFFLPEPIGIDAGERLSVRISSNLTEATPYSAVKIIYQESAVRLNFQNGLLNVGSIIGTGQAVPNIPFTQVGIHLKRNSWSAGSEIVSAGLEVSEDNGGSWSSLVGFTTDGGVSLNRDGTTAIDSSASIPAFTSANPQRRVRPAVTNTAAVNTKIDVVLK